MKNLLEKVKKIVKEKKKLIIILSVILIVGIVSVLIYNYFNSNNGISIEVASTNVNYIYGPSGETTIKLKENDKVDLKIIVESSKTGRVKCFTTNDKVAQFIDDNTLKAISHGSVGVYCELFNNKSNYINVIIGG